LASLFLCLFLIIFVLVFFFSSSSSFQKKQKALASPHDNDTTTHTTEEEQQQKKKSNRSNHHQNQNARRATIGRVLRRTRERARREAIERDRSSSGGEHREEQFRTRWVGQGILVKILFSNREKVNVGIAMDRFFLSLSLSLC
jgi:predicted Holliday junction resolvase-like endonuclease